MTDISLTGGYSNLSVEMKLCQRYLYVLAASFFALANLDTRGGRPLFSVHNGGLTTVVSQDKFVS